jgi:hypothetical protein
VADLVRPSGRPLRLGFAVKVLGDGGLPSNDARRWQSGPHLRRSLEMLNGVFDHLERHSIGMYRYSADQAKAKDLALLRLRDQLAERGLHLA